MPVFLNFFSVAFRPVRRVVPSFQSMVDPLPRETVNAACLRGRLDGRDGSVAVRWYCMIEIMSRMCCSSYFWNTAGLAACLKFP